MKILKTNKNKYIPRQNYENHEIIRIPYHNYENHESLFILRENHELN